MFNLDRPVSDCRAALAADRSHRLVREVVAGAVSDPTSVLRVLGRTEARSAPEALSRAGSDDPQRDLGPNDDDHAPRS